MRETVIVSAVRTPTGKFLGGLKDFKATELGAMAVREAVQARRHRPGDRRRVHLGNVVSAGAGQAPARQAAMQRRPRPTASARSRSTKCAARASRP